MAQLVGQICSDFVNQRINLEELKAAQMARFEAAFASESNAPESEES
jgi:hypothetical protein